MASSKQRLDVLLVERQLVSSREQAQALIMAGHVLVNGQRMDKSGEKVPTSVQLTVKERLPYVSRGGLKLAEALDACHVNVSERLCLDVGASTGGFTDCLLQRGAKSVIAIDVGTNQLDWRLRQDPRVVVMEQTNIRHLDPQTFPYEPNLAVADVSFIGVLKILPVTLGILETAQNAEALVLLKPQFEYKDFFPTQKFTGVVKQLTELKTIVLGTCQAIEAQFSAWQVSQVIPSPIRGTEGNREYLLHLTLKSQGLQTVSTLETIAEIVKNSY